MAVRLGEYVICGEICNTSNYSVHGWIRLRGQESPVLLQLTGNCDADLVGRHIRFEARNAAQREADAAPPGEGFPRLAPQQVGPTGTMTAARQVKVADGSPAELYLRNKMGEPAPAEWKRCLYLEWFSQNGRVVVELPDPVLEFLDPEREAAERAQWFRELCDMDGPAMVVLDELDSMLGDSDSDEEEDEDLWDEGELEEEFDQDDEEDPYGLFPADWPRQWEEEAARIDDCLRGDDDDDASVWHETELMDELIGNRDGVPLGQLFDGPLKLPRPEQLASEDEAESALKTLLAQLALFGISLDICPHFTPRDAYRLLLEEICPGETAYPELRNTQWVQHFMTSEFCPQCEAELEGEDEGRHRGETPDGGEAF